MFEFINKIFKKEKKPAETEKDSGDAGAEKDDKKKEDGKEKKHNDEPLNLAVHVMPRRFLFAAVQARKSKSAGLIILAAGLVLLLALGSGAYYYFFVMKSVPKAEPEIAETTGKPSAQETAAEAEKVRKETEAARIEAAKDFYISFKNSVDAISAIEDYDTLINYNGDEIMIADWLALKEKADKLGDAEKDGFVALLKNYRPKVSEFEAGVTGSISGAGASLAAAGIGYDIKAALVSGGAYWKISGEDGFIYLDEENATTTLDSWLDKNLTPALPESGNQLMPGKDTDADGLTDKEEVLIGTDPEKADSDGDGYPDLDEMDNFYNPAGPGKLGENSAIRSYVNSSFNYNLYVPADWSEEKAGGSDTVIFRSPDNEFLQIIVQPNAEKADIKTWYASQFGGEAPLASSEVSRTGADGAILWEGIKSADGLNVYLAEPDKEYVYVLSYSPGEEKTLDYVNIFGLMIKSFELK